MDQSKTCTRCGETKPVSEFYRRDGGKPGSQCKACILLRMKLAREPHLVRAPRLHRDELGKACPKCRDYKLFELFRRPVSGAIGTYCRACQLAVDRASKERHRDRVNALRREQWAQPVDLTEIRRCPRCGEDKPRADFPANGKAGYCKPCRAAYARDRNRIQRDKRREERWGLTTEQFADLLRKQGGGCAICGGTRITNGRWISGDGRDLHVDHDHVTGQIRGLLCNRCNPALGMMDDDPHRLIRAAEYLKNPPALM